MRDARAMRAVAVPLLLAAMLHLLRPAGAQPPGDVALGGASPQPVHPAQHDHVAEGPVEVSTRALAPSFPRFWGTTPVPDRWAVNSSWLVPRGAPVLATLPRPAPGDASAAALVPFSDSVSLVRVLGGWGNATWRDVSGDVVVRGAGGGLEYRLDRLFEHHLDDFVAAGLRPLLVLDNVPWALAGADPFTCSYGCCAPPANLTEWGEAIEAIVRASVKRYGADAVAAWRFRVGTESDGPRFGAKFPDGLDTYKAIYNASVTAVKRASPRSLVGPCVRAALFSARSGHCQPLTTLTPLAELRGAVADAHHRPCR